MTTAVKVATTSMKAPNIYHKPTGITRKKWGLDEELLLLRLFKIYNRSWDQYVAYYPGRNAASIKNKYYTLTRRGDAYNRAIYGNVALDIENTSIPSKRQRGKSSPLPTKRKRISDGNVLDLSVINYKTALPCNDMTSSTPHCFTPDATDAFVGSDFNINGGVSGILLGTEYRDTVSLGPPTSDDGAVTPSLLTDSTLLADDFSIEVNTLTRNNTNPLITHNAYPAIRPNSDTDTFKSVPYDYHLLPSSLREAQINHHSPLNFMFTLPIQTAPYKSPHPLITHTYPVLPPVFHHSPAQGFQQPYQLGMLPPTGFPFGM